MKSRDEYWRGYRHAIEQYIGDRKENLSVPASGYRPNEGIESRSPEEQLPVNVELPKHLFIPAGAQSVDIRVAADVAANTLTPALLMSFQAPKGARVHFINYGIFSDGILAANQEFIPRVDGNRVFPFQGDPNDNFRINLGLAPDLSNTSLIQAQLTLDSEQTVEWLVINRNAVDIAMGVRMVGYVDRSQRRTTARFGG